MTTVDAMRAQFLAGADVVLAAISDERVAAAWEHDSILEGQTVGGLAAHLARGGVWVVGDYLDLEVPPSDLDFEDAPHYYAQIIDGLTESDHAGVRSRGAVIAAQGRDAVVAQLAGRIDALRERLPHEPPERVLSVYAGKTMRLDDYLVTRLVEQVVHLDDLARSLGIEPWPNPPGADALVIACGADVGRLRRGATAMIRALYRDGTAGTLPVL